MSTNNFHYVIEHCKKRVSERTKKSRNYKLFLSHKRFLDQIDMNTYNKEKYLNAIYKIYKDVVKDEIKQDL